jgi:glycosyltransferase involved in cell wall biosynthesis
MKKIAIVVQRFGEEIMGGAERHALLLAKNLSINHDITVLTTCAKDYYNWKNEYKAGKDFVSGITTLRFETDFERNKKIFDLLSEEVFLDLENKDLNEDWIVSQGPYSSNLFNFLEDNEEHFDLFIFVTYLYASTVLGSRKISKRKKILIPTAHDETPIYLSVFRELFNSFDGIIYNTESEKKFVEGLFKNENTTNLVAGISIELPEYSKNAHLTENVFSYIGRIDENKGVKELMAFYMRGGFSSKLVLAGQKHLKIDSKIEYLGVLTDEEKFNLINRSLFVVIPSRFESLSLVLLEAFACRKPVLVNGDCEVLKEHVIKSNAGLCFHDFESFLESVLWMEKNPEKLKVMGENGYKYFIENYSESVVVNKIENFLKKFL